MTRLFFLDGLYRAQEETLEGRRAELYRQLRSLRYENWDYQTRLKSQSILKELQELEGEDY